MLNEGMVREERTNEDLSLEFQSMKLGHSDHGHA